MTAEVTDDPWAGMPTGWPSCKCGCGQPVARADRTDTGSGLRKGDPRKYHCLQCRYDNGRIKFVATGTRICTTCQREKPADQMRYDSRKPDKVGSQCRDCVNASRRRHFLSKRSKDLLIGDRRPRKLPPYDTLKKLYVDDGMSLRQIADKYRVSPRGVLLVIKARAERRGEWPLLSDYERRKRRTGQLQKHAQPTVNAMVLRTLVREYLDSNGLSYGDLANEAHIPVQYMRFFMAPNAAPQRVTVARAVQLMEAIGEEVPDWMRETAEMAVKKLLVRRHLEARGVSRACVGNHPLFLAVCRGDIVTVSD